MARDRDVRDIDYNPSYCLLIDNSKWPMVLLLEAAFAAVAGLVSVLVAVVTALAADWSLVAVAATPAAAAVVVVEDDRPSATD